MADVTDTDRRRRKLTIIVSAVVIVLAVLLGLRLAVSGGADQAREEYGAAMRVQVADMLVLQELVDEGKRQLAECSEEAACEELSRAIEEAEALRLPELSGQATREEYEDALDQLEEVKASCDEATETLADLVGQPADR